MWAIEPAKKHGIDVSERSREIAIESELLLPVPRSDVGRLRESLLAAEVILGAADRELQLGLELGFDTYDAMDVTPPSDVVNAYLALHEHHPNSSEAVRGLRYAVGSGMSASGCSRSTAKTFRFSGIEFDTARARQTLREIGATEDLRRIFENERDALLASPVDERPWGLLLYRACTFGMPDFLPTFLLETADRLNVRSGFRTVAKDWFDAARSRVEAGVGQQSLD